MRGGTRSTRSAFSIVDVLVSLSVIAILIGILLPTMWGVQRTAHKIMCRSNVKQHGVGLHLYAENNREALPRSIFIGSMDDPDMRQTHKTTTLRIGQQPEKYAGEWDGLGLLYQHEYLKTPQIFYCPAERGETRYIEYADRWAEDGTEIVGNYQYRGEGPDGIKFLYDIRPQSASMVTNALSSKKEYSHGDGSNVLRADLSVYWFADLNGQFLAQLADDPFMNGPGGIDDLWDTIDTLGPPNGN